MKKIIAAILMFSMFLVLFAGCSKDEYRLVKVENYTGTVDVYRQSENENISIFEGMNLISEDVVNVSYKSSLTMQIDKDKYIQACENTVFTLEATGNEENGSVRLDIKSGTQLIKVENKLPKNSTFEVSTPNAIFSVRGTEFIVTYDAYTKQTKLDVIEGVVNAQYDGNSENVSAGNGMVISENGAETFELLMGKSSGNYSDSSENVIQLTMTVDYDVRTEKMSPDMIDRSFLNVDYRSWINNNYCSFFANMPCLVTRRTQDDTGYIRDDNLYSSVESVKNNLFENYIYPNADELEESVRDILSIDRINEIRKVDSIDSITLNINGNSRTYPASVTCCTLEDGRVIVDFFLSHEDSIKFINDMGLDPYIVVKE